MLECFKFIFSSIGQIISFIFTIEIDNGIKVAHIFLVIFFIIVVLGFFINSKGGDN